MSEPLIGLILISSENEAGSAKPRPPADQRGEDAKDLVFAALDFLRGGLSSNGGASGAPALAWQKENLRQWSEHLGLLLNPEELPQKVLRGGQEHDLYHDEIADRYFKVTRNGVFGLSPGIELSLVSSADDPRRFHLWEASPMEYLERLHTGRFDWGMEAEFDIPIRRPCRQEVDEAAIPLYEHGLEGDGCDAAIVLVGDPVETRLPERRESRAWMSAFEAVGDHAPRLVGEPQARGHDRVLSHPSWPPSMFREA